MALACPVFLRNQRLQKLLIFAIFALLMLYAHLPLPFCGDDAYLLPLVGVRSIPAHFAELFRYNGKIFTDFLAFLFYHLPYTVWKVWNVGVFVAVALLMTRLFTDGSARGALWVCLCIGLFPLGYLGTAGYIATCTNYLYPLCGLLFIALQLKALCKGAKPWRQLFSLPVMAYVLNQDQAACILVGGLFLFLLYAAKTKICDVRWAMGYFAVALFGYGVMFCLPGHLNRMTDTLEMELYLPDYVNWSLGKKLYHGYTSTVANVFFHHNTIPILLFALLFLVSLRDKRLLSRLAGLIPLLGFSGLTIFHKSRFLVYHFDMPELRPLTEKAGLCGFVFAAVCLICMVFTVLRCTRGHTRATLLGLMVLGGGSRVMMGFSATLYASQFRTFTYLFFCLLAMCLVLLQQLARPAETLCFRKK